jgi:hypothetical protein
LEAERRAVPERVLEAAGRRDDTDFRLALDLRDGAFRAVDFRAVDLRDDVDFLAGDLREAAALRVGRDFEDFLFAAERLSGMSTPARRASESPMAIACFAFFAPCSPSRILSISRCTNSPAWVLADLPARLSARARWMVSLSGISTPLRGTEPDGLQ